MVLVEETTQQQLMQVWLDALRGGEYSQVYGRLFSDNDLGPRHCCLGVADEVCFGAQFYKMSLGVSQFDFVDDQGQSTRLSPARQQELGLSQNITAEDLNVAERYWHGPGMLNGRAIDVADRMSLLITLNDNKTSFAEIADFMEEAGWLT